MASIKDLTPENRQWLAQKSAAMGIRLDECAIQLLDRHIAALRFFEPIPGPVLVPGRHLGETLKPSSQPQHASRLDET